MTLQEAVELLCGTRKYCNNKYLVWDIKRRLFDLDTIDGCLALSRELGLQLWWMPYLKGYEAHWCNNKRTDADCLGLFPTELAAIQAALAAGIERLYGEKP